MFTRHVKKSLPFVIFILIFSSLTTTFQCIRVEGQAPKTKFDLEIERDPNTLKPKILVLKDEGKIAVKVRNNGPNSTKCEVGVRVTGGYGSLYPEGYKKFSGKTEFKVEILPGAQTWVFIKTYLPEVDLDEDLKVEAFVANEVDVEGSGSALYFILGSDTNPTNNEGSKEFFVDHKIGANSLGSTNFVIKNPFQDREILLQILTLPLSPVPNEWKLVVRRLSDFKVLTEGIFNVTVLTLMPGEIFYGTFTIKAPEEIPEGQSINLRLIASEIASGKIMFTKEIYLAYDNKPPQIQAINVTANEGFVDAWLSTQDASSGVEEGLIYYSTDDGKTWSSKQLSYSFDLELVYSKLTTKIGPFNNGTEVKYYFIVKDGVGNWAYTQPATTEIEIKNLEITKLRQKVDDLQSVYNSLEVVFSSLETEYHGLEADLAKLKALNTKMAEDYVSLTQLMLYVGAGAVLVVVALIILVIHCRIARASKRNEVTMMTEGR